MDENQTATTSRLLLKLLLLLGIAGTSWGAITIDANTAMDGLVASTTIATPTFSTISENELLLAFIASDYLSGTNTTVSNVTGAGLTWVLVRRTNGQQGTSEIWRAFASSPLSNAKISATLSQSVISSITVMSFAGVDTSGVNGSGAIGATNGKSAASGAPTVSLVTTRNNSWVFGVGNDFDNPIARTIGTGQSLLHQYLTPTGDTYWAQMQTGVTPVSGTTVNINATAPTTDRYNLTICEVLPAVSGVATWNISGAISPTAGGAGATLTLSGTANGTVTAYASGNYTFNSLANGPYTITPAKSGYTFTPPSQSVTVSGANLTAINFTAQAVPTWSISGTINPPPGSGGATVTLSGTASGTATTDASGNYIVNGLANGSYTVTPSKNGYTFTPPNQPAVVSGANITGIDFTAQAVPPSSAISLDVSTSTDRPPASTTIASPVFSTASGNELLLAFISTDYLSGANSAVTNVSGAGLTWALVVRTNAQSGGSEIWRAFAPTRLISATVTATLSQSVSSSMTVMSFSGVDTSGTNGSGAIGAVASANAASGLPSATLVTTRNNSWVFGVGNDFDNAIARTPGTGQTLVHQYLTPAGDTYWVQRQNSTTPASGTTVALNDTAPSGDRFNLSIVEIVPATSGVPTWSISGTISPAVEGSGTTVTLGGAVVATAIANASGTYSFSGLQNGVYTVTPSKSNDTFSPANQSVTINGASLPTINFTVGSAGASVTGQFSPVMTWPIVSLNAVLLYTGKVLVYDRPAAGSTARVWDPGTNTFASVPNNFTDLFCSGHSALADGRILVIGGHGSVISGTADVNIFDPAAQTWTMAPRMKYERWYPTATTLPDGRILAITGAAKTDTDYIPIPEIYNPATNSWTQLTAASRTAPTYGQSFLLPNGKIANTGNSEFASNASVLDIATQTWTTVDPAITDGYSVMYEPGKVMKTGSASDSGTAGASVKLTNIIDFTATSPAWQSVAPMMYPRTFHNLTILPDGNVLAVGGSSMREGYDVRNAIYPTEMWSPVTKTWTVMASLSTPRLYHSIGLLLPDARVLVSGGGRDGTGVDQFNAEIYSPPYLFKGIRPTITAAPDMLTYGNNFSVSTPDDASISSVSLIRLGATTHGFDQDQRFMKLSFMPVGGSLTVQAPANANLAPPGYYMLFLVNSNGVPSVSKILKMLP